MSDALADAPTTTQQEDDGSAWLVAWVALLLLLNGNATRPLTMTQRTRARKLLRVKFEDDALRAAQRVTAGEWTAAAWLDAVEVAKADYARQMAVAGAGTMPEADVRQRTTQALAEQRPFLERFGGVVAAGALTVAAIAARTKLYGSVGWGMFWAAQGGGAAEGVVDLWIARDDNNTCRQCAPRNGQYYLPGQGPMPGIDCDGGGACRCERRQVVDMAIWRRLMGR